MIVCGNNVTAVSLYKKAFQVRSPTKRRRCSLRYSGNSLTALLLNMILQLYIQTVSESVHVFVIHKLCYSLRTWSVPDMHNRLYH